MFLINGQGKASPTKSCTICHGFCWTWRSQELHDTFLSAVFWHLCLLADFTCIDRGNVGQNQGREAPALLKPKLGLHIPHLQWGAAVWQEQASRVMRLPRASLILAVPSQQPAKTRMGETPNGSWCWMTFDDVQH